MGSDNKHNHPLIGKRIRYLRDSLLGLTQREFVDRINEFMPWEIAVTTLSTWERAKPLKGGKIPGPDHQVLAAIYRAFTEGRRDGDPVLSYLWLLTGEGHYDVRAEEIDKELQEAHEAHEASAAARPVAEPETEPLGIDALMPDDLHRLPDRAKAALLTFIREASESEALVQSLSADGGEAWLLEEAGPTLSNMDAGVTEWFDRIRSSIADRVFGLVRQTLAGGEGWRGPGDLPTSEAIAIVGGVIATLRPLVASFHTEAGNVYLGRELPTAARDYIPFSAAGTRPTNTDRSSTDTP